MGSYRGEAALLESLIVASQGERLLTVVYAERPGRGILRIISARRATRHEKKLYQDEA
jgi:uncharacterized DUF497 family protein